MKQHFEKRYTLLQNTHEKNSKMSVYVYVYSKIHMCPSYIPWNLFMYYFIYQIIKPCVPYDSYDMFCR